MTEQQRVVLDKLKEVIRHPATQPVFIAGGSRAFIKVDGALWQDLVNEVVELNKAEVK